ncbi:MAG TPA: adenosylcobalamin-dependent ribonucleoside-diphosphate reductase [Ktedonobacteraceae bacterium]|nr:adenosylcobalamin-dependent ribonucleoside-diphosphate reductase [Ktedonobacteraceae bacterium]
MLEQQKVAAQSAQDDSQNETTGMTQLEGIRQKVFMDRYSLKDETGKALEYYPEQLWARVARGIAEAERTPEARAEWEKKFYDALADFQFVPGGRILAGAGSGHSVTYYNCMPPGQEVLTAEGYRPISEIKIGDRVVTHRNRLRPVVHKFERETEETLYIIKPKKIGYDDLRVTGDHKVYVIRSEWVNTHRSRDGLRLQHEPDWIPAKEIKVGDYVAVAHNGEEHSPETIFLQDYLSGYETLDGKLLKKTTCSDHGYVSDWETHYKIHDRLVLDEELCYLFGRWLGDGCITHRTGTDIPSGIKIVFSLEEKDEAVEIARIIGAKFGIDSSIKLSSTERWYDLWVNSMPLGQFFKIFLGCYSHSKQLPDQLMHLPAELTLELLHGLFSADGYVSGNKLGIVLANRTLTVQVHQLLLRLGYVFSIRENTHRLGRVPAYRIQATANECAPLFEHFFGVQAPEYNTDLKYYFEYNDLQWVRIGEMATEDYTGTVLDIEVEEDHSFISAGVVVSNCFVIPSPEDSRQGILDNLKTMTEIMARGGGVGINLSTLRPRGSYIRTVNGTASGPCSWAQLYSVATGDVIQQGGSRRGALMLMLNDDHPDIEEFITVKRTPGKIEHANLSICISDKFMQAVKDDADWNLVWNGEVKKTVRARYLWDLICTSAWESAEPGMVFIDRYNKLSNTWYYENIRCVNPCGEQGLPPYGVCNLGALNLSAFVENGEMDYERLAEKTKVAMRFLDNVIDSTEYFIKENEEAQLGTRRTGLGTMGLADALIKMKIAYGSDESVPVIEKIYTTIRDAAYEASADYAAEKGPFPRFERDKYMQGYFIKQLPKAIQEKIKKQGIRNAVLLTQAPTGTTSLFAGVSSGIEPVYDFAMIRRDRTGEHILYHPLLQAWRDKHPNEPTPHYFVSSKDLTPEEHVRVQATIQKYTDSSISKTVNAPNSHTVEQVETLYRLAYEMGCKGITYYRDGSRDAVLTRVEDEKKAEKQEEQQSVMLEPVASIQEGIKKRPVVVQGYTRQVKAPEGTINITINSDENGPLEVFLNVGKAGSDIAALAEALGRLISINLRLLSPLSQIDRTKQIAEQLRGIGGSRSVGFGAQQVRSLPDAVARALELHIISLQEAAEQQFVPTQTSSEQNDNRHNENGYSSKQDAETSEASPLSLSRLSVTGNLCPQCGCNTMVFEEGCKKCYSCGYSEC